MPEIHIPFGPKPHLLASLGCKAPMMTGDFGLEEGSFLEPPVAVLSRVENPTFLQVGAFTSISGGLIGGVRIGRYCALAPEVRIGAYNHPTDWLTSSRVAHYPVVHDWDQFCAPDRVDFIRRNVRSFPNSRRVTTLGHDVWVGQGSFIRAGVTLGTGCIVGARSVVVKDVPPYAVVAGVPATVKRFRFDDQTIARLLALEWWRFSLYDCFDIPFDRIDAALDQFEERIAAGSLQEYRPERLTAQVLRDRCAGHV